jgi:hypothetical protein
MRWITPSHRLTPADSASQKVLDWAVTAEGRRIRRGLHRRRGRPVTTMTVKGPAEAGGRRGRRHGGDERHGGRAAGPPRGRSRRWSTCRSSAATAANGALIELKDRALKGAGQAGDLDRAHLLSGEVAKAIAYMPGTTHAHTTAAEAMEQGQGVCQDHAHALIALAQAAGMPARYVSGYLLGRCRRCAERGEPCLGGTVRAGARLDRFRSGERMLPGRALYPARLGTGRARGGTDPGRVAQGRASRRWKSAWWWRSRSPSSRKAAAAVCVVRRPGA